MTDNVTLKEDEILAITSIFGEDSFQKEEEEKKATDSVSSFSTYIFKLSLDDNNSITTNNNNVGSKKELKIRFYFSLDYPSDEPPIYEILSVYCGVMKIDDLIRLEIDQNFRKLFVPGEVVIFSWIEWLKDYLLNKLLEEEFSSININDDNSEGNEVNEKVEEELMTVEKNLNLENIKNINSETCPKIFHGEPLEHKKSIFLAHLAKVNNIQEVKLVRSMLLSDRKIAKATHNIMAYRILLDNGAILQDNDDDGETAAGSRLLHLLQMLDSRNVIVVVTRWYGGILLGPDRFRDINNCARDLLEKFRLPPNSMNINNSTFRQSEFSKDTTDMDIYEATAAGNLDKVKELLAPKDSGGIVTAFHRANIPNLSSGLTPLHYAASRGHLEIVEWLIEYAGAIVDLEDQTGENALLKASYNGHISVVKYLLEKEANVSQKDNDGWTALHNASAQGYLPIIKHLLEVAKADVDVGSNKNITPLMNASSRGHVGIVEYLLNRAGANPFIKNSFGETAFDSAATSNEAYICELLEKAERDWWKGKRAIPEPISFRDLENSLPPINQPYDVFAFHISVPIILHENQRASSIFPVSLRRPPKYSAANLLKTDYCSPWSLYPSGQPSSKEAVKLPVGPNSSTVSIVTNISSRSQNRLWFWVDEWHIDMTHPRIDAQGWQYARSFDEADKKWSIIPPANANTWVRRRRWVRVMKRRMNLSESNSEDWERLILLKNGDTLPPSMKSKTLKTIFSKQPKSPTQYSKMEEDARNKAAAANRYYKSQLSGANLMRNEYYNIHLPRIITELKSVADECDAGLQYHLARYSYLYESAMVSDASAISPVDLEDGPALRTIVEQINNDSDYLNYVQSFKKKSQKLKINEIPYNQYNMSEQAINIINPTNPKPVFGTDLSELMKRDGGVIPIILRKCVTAVEKYGLESLGIYRLSGVTSQVQSLKSLFDKDAESVDLDSEENLKDINNVSSLLKLWFRELPDPLFPRTMYQDFMKINELHPFFHGQPSSKEAVKLPVGPNSSTVSIVTNISSRSQNRLWFWVDEWHIDMTHPRIDAQGWQYARSFDEADKKWSIIPPANANTWVRRRRWVRVMKRRMNLSESNNPLRFINENNSQLDYIEKAETIIKLSQDYNKRESIDMSEQLIRYKEAIRILKTGIESETDNERKQEANSLIDSFTQHSEYLESIRKGNSDVYAKSPTSSFHDVPMTPTHIPNSSSNNIFKLELPITPSTASFKSFETIEDPWSMTTTNDDIAGNSSFSNYYGNGGVGNGQSMMTSPTRLNSQFSLNITSVPTTNSITSFGVWENDDDVHECRQCRRRFNLWIRRHHCRRCGQVVCDRCSLSRLILPPSQVIFDPSAPNDSSSSSSSASQYHRVCDSCHSSMGHPTKKKRSNSITSSTSISVVPGSKSDQEHIKNCLENQNGNSVSVYKYVGEQKIAF
ncbi:21410_t:CDS:10 [Entrophospora sp. SA101]|nr:21410_t:CDS:10 [Entrophospora sp. SA101]